jgi:hypothetical protein
MLWSASSRTTTQFRLERNWACFSTPEGRGPWKVRVIARQQQPDVGVGRDGAVRQRRIAGAENAIGFAVDTELGLHRGLHVDIGQHPETLGLERFGHPRHRLIETVTNLNVETVHFYLLWNVFDMNSFGNHRPGKCPFGDADPADFQRDR